MEYTNVVEVLKNNINWQRFVNLCASIGNELNSPQWRFLKAVFLESAVAAYSKGMVTYVGESERGCDFVIPSLNNAKIEMKYTAEALYTAKGTARRDCKSVTLLNSKGTNTHLALPEEYADYLLIVESRGASLISKENLQKYVVVKGDSLTACIPTSELTVIFQPTDLGEIIKKDLGIKAKFLELISDIVENI